MSETPSKVYAAIYTNDDGKEVTVAAMATPGQTLESFKLQFEVILAQRTEGASLVRVWEMSDEERAKYGLKLPGEPTVH